MRVLAISGSLRAASVNSTLLRAAARLAPADIKVHLYAGVGGLPLFNPDLESQVPEEVRQLREAVAAADALVLASPEYAHGVTSVIKNTLDWLVSFAPFGDKPVALFNASPRSQYADPALRETLKTMSAAIVNDACFSYQLVGAQMGEEEMVRSAAVSGGVRAALAALRDYARAERSGGNAAFALS